MQYLILGATGFIGGYIYRKMRQDGLEVIGTTYKEDSFTELKKYDMEHDSIENLAALCSAKKKTAIVCAAKSNIDFCKENYAEAYQINVSKTKDVITALVKKGFFVIYFSSDSVFDGNRGHYCEQDKTNPVNRYGEMKAEMEQFLVKNLPEVCILRTAKVIGTERASQNVLTSFENLIQQKKKIRCIKGSISSFIAVEDIYRACITISEKELHGIYNVVGDFAISRTELAKKYLKQCRMSEDIVEEIDVEELHLKDKRPLNVGMSNHKFKTETGFTFTDVDFIIQKYIEKCNAKE